LDDALGVFRKRILFDHLLVRDHNCNECERLVEVGLNVVVAHSDAVLG